MLVKPMKPDGLPDLQIPVTMGLTVKQQGLRL